MLAPSFREFIQYLKTCRSIARVRYHGGYVTVKVLVPYKKLTSVASLNEEEFLKRYDDYRKLLERDVDESAVREIEISLQNRDALLSFLKSIKRRKKGVLIPIICREASILKHVESKFHFRDSVAGIYFLEPLVLLEDYAVYLIRPFKAIELLNLFLNPLSQELADEYRNEVKVRGKSDIEIFSLFASLITNVYEWCKSICLRYIQEYSTSLLELYTFANKVFKFLVSVRPSLNLMISIISSISRGFTLSKLYDDGKVRSYASIGLSKKHPTRIANVVYIELEKTGVIEVVLSEYLSHYLRSI